MEASITFKKVGQTLNDKTVLVGLSFGIEKNSTVAIIGENDDSSLTEFLNLISGKRDPSHGSLFIHGFDSIKQKSKIRNLIGYVPFSNDLDPLLTAKENINYINSFYKIDKNILEKRYQHYSSLLNLRDELNENVNDLSPGKLRKIILLRELTRDPKILILDHPTAFMNAKDTELTWDLLRSLQTKLTIIYRDSTLYRVEKFHDRILVFNNGTVDLDDSFSNMLKNWIGRYRYTIIFEQFSTELFSNIEKVDGIILPIKDENKLTFNANESIVLLQVMEVLNDVIITDIITKNLHLKDLLAARYMDGGIV